MSSLSKIKDYIYIGESEFVELDNLGYDLELIIELFTIFTFNLIFPFGMLLVLSCVCRMKGKLEDKRDEYEIILNLFKPQALQPSPSVVVVGFSNGGYPSNCDFPPNSYPSDTGNYPNNNGYYPNNNSYYPNGNEYTPEYAPNNYQSNDYPSNDCPPNNYENNKLLKIQSDYSEVEPFRN
jgi:hypothetical protein